MLSKLNFLISLLLALEIITGITEYTIRFLNVNK